MPPEREPQPGFVWCIGGGPLNGEAIPMRSAWVMTAFNGTHLGHYELRAGAYRWQDARGSF